MQWTIDAGFIVILSLLGFNPSFSQRAEPLWTSAELPLTLANDLAEVIFESEEGAIWFSFTHAGLYRFNGYTFSHLTGEDFGMEPEALNRIISMYQTSDGKIWMSARDRSVVIFNPETGQMKKLKETQDPELGNCLKRVWDFYESPDQSIWMATWRGLVRYQPATSRFELFRYPFKTSRNDDVHPSVFRTIEPDPEDPQYLWIGGVSGLFTFDTKNKQFYHHRQPDKMYLDGHRDFKKEHLQYLITDMVITGDKLYLASWGGGVLEYNKVSKEWQQYLLKPYQTARELDENIVNQLIWIPEQKLLFTSDSGSGVLDPDHREIKWVKNETGDISPTYSYAILQDRHGIYRVSTYHNGVGEIKGAWRAQIARRKPAFEYALISVENDYVWTGYLSDLPERIPVEPDQDTIRIEFALINPADRTAVEYQYKIPGVTGDWISNGIEPAILLYSLPGGTFKFQMRTMETGGEWVYAPEILIERNLYIFQKTWFWLLSVAGLLIISGMVIRVSIKKRLTRESMEKQMIQLKMQALQAQMNPHFIFNSLNAIQNLILKEDGERAADHMNLFARLVREILKNADKKLVLLQDDLAMLENYIKLEQHRFAEKFFWSVYVDPAVSPDQCYLPPLLLQPYIENAIWHGLMPLKRPGKIEIRFVKRDGQLEITIEDDGVGRERSGETESTGKLKNGMGMKIAGNRIGMLSKLFDCHTSVELSDRFPEKRDKGTQVVIRIPYIDLKFYHAFNN